MSKKLALTLAAIAVLIPLLFMASGLGQAANVSDSTSGAGPTHAITVFGKGKFYTPSDEASLSFSVRTVRNTASRAMSDNSEAITKVLNALRSQGLTEAEIKTGNVSLYPQEDWRNGRAPKIISYTAENRVIIRTKKLDKLGGIIDAASTAGATEISGLTFQLSEDSDAEQECLKIALKNARKKAEAIAKEMGVNLGNAIIISEGVQDAPVEAYDHLKLRAAADFANEMAPPIMPQDIQVIANVTVSFEIQ